jgi:protein required for attachment to host cells
MEQKRTWILVCDASRARLFEETSPTRRYEVVGSFEHPESRAHTAELVADAQGRKPVGGSRGINARPGGFRGRPGAEPDTDPKQVEAQKFARQLAAVLEKGLTDRAYEALYLVAPAKFLGLVKAALGDQVRGHVEATVDRDLVQLDLREIERRLRGQRAA